MIPIKDHPNYLINEHGQVWSVRSKRFLKPSYTEGGYASIEAWKDGKRKRLLIHRLVATAFIPNPNNLPQVNHKDENPRNNDVSNLEWCTAKYNMNYGEGAKTRHFKIDYTKPVYKINAVKNGRKACKPVLMFTKNGEFVKEFVSAVEAEKETGVNRKYISMVIHGKSKTAKGYVFRLKERGNDLSFQY